MNHKLDKELSLEQKPNSEQTDDNKQVIPSIANANVTGSLSFVMFAPDNKIKFFMDQIMWQGIPEDILFFPTYEMSNGLIEFVGDGYGILPKHKLAGKYGSGSILIPKKEIPELVEWCLANFLQSKRN